MDNEFYIDAFNFQEVYGGKNSQETIDAMKAAKLENDNDDFFRYFIGLKQKQKTIVQDIKRRKKESIIYAKYLAGRNIPKGVNPEEFEHSDILLASAESELALVEIDIELAEIKIKHNVFNYILNNEQNPKEETE